MATTINAIINYDINDLQAVSILDATSYEAPDSVQNVNGIRILFSTVNSVDNAEETQDLVAWTEYQVQGEAADINGITYAVGDLVMLANDFSYPGDSTFLATGRYGQYISDVLPVTGEPYEFTPDQCNISAVDTLYFSDNVVIADLEHYTTKYQAAETLAAGTYLVVGTPDDAVEVDGSKTVYVGEIYTSAGSETFTGAPYMVLYSDEEQFVFSTLYQSYKIWEAYLSAMATTVPPDQKLNDNFLKVAALLGSLDTACDTTSNISTGQLQDNINQIIEYYAVA